jgi:hypothetical protein
MKYNDEILNKIAESYSKKIDENTNLDNVILGYLEMMKNGSKIHIKKKNRGKFSASARKAGQSVQEHAKSVLNNPNATTLQKRRAQFAINAKKFKH